MAAVSRTALAPPPKGFILDTDDMPPRWRSDEYGDFAGFVGPGLRRLSTTHGNATREQA
jgi:hypothetical protein